MLLIVLTFAPWAFKGSAPLYGVLRAVLGLLAYLACLMSFSSQLVSCQSSPKPSALHLMSDVLEQRTQLWETGGGKEHLLS